jgi:hypothetical protein
MYFVAETANDLVLKCAAAAQDGADFPAVWESILRRNPFVVSLPLQTFSDDEGPQIEVRLLSGQRIVYGSTSNEYSVLPAPRRRPF